MIYYLIYTLRNFKQLLELIRVSKSLTGINSGPSRVGIIAKFLFNLKFTLVNTKVSNKNKPATAIILAVVFDCGNIISSVCLADTIILLVVNGGFAVIVTAKPTLVSLRILKICIIFKI